MADNERPNSPPSDPKTLSSPCPGLNVMLTRGWLAPDQDGRVSLTDVSDALTRLGFVGGAKALVGALPLVADSRRDILKNVYSCSFSLPELSGGLLDHELCTHSLQPSPEKPHQHASWAFDDEKFTQFFTPRFIFPLLPNDERPVRWLAFCVGYMLKMGGKPLKLDSQTVRALALTLLDMSLLMSAFGYVDDQGELCMTVDQIRTVYENAGVPEGWAPSRAVGIRDLLTTWLGLLQELLKADRDGSYDKQPLPEDASHQA